MELEKFILEIQIEIQIQILNKICAIASHKNAGPLIPPCDSPT